MTEANDASTFWSAVSQIIPVLALALVIEVRVIGRRWTRNKKSMPALRVRVPALVGLAVIGAALFGQEIAALGFLIDSEGDARVWRLIALGVASAGMLGVVGLPVANIAAVGLSDLRYSRRSLRRMAKRLRGFELELLVHRNQQIGSVLKTHKAIAFTKKELADAESNPYFDPAPYAGLVEMFEGNLVTFTSVYNSLLETTRNLETAQAEIAKGPTPEGRKRVLKQARRLLRDYAD